VTKSSIFFVTGASGFVGRHVCKLLTQSGYKVKALVRSEDTELTRFGIKLWIGDLWDKSLLQEVISDVDVVIHCAGYARFGNGFRYYKENVELTEHVIHAAKLYSNNARFVYISTIGAIDRAKDDPCVAPLTEERPGLPTSDYGRSKLLAEEVVKYSGLPFSIIRPAMVVGADMRSDSHFSVFARQSLTGSLVARFAWTGEFSVIHVEDLAVGILTVATNENAVGETYFCAGEPISIADFFMQCTTKKIRIPLSILPAVVRYFIKWMPFALKAMLLPALTASDEKLRALGWFPRYSAKTALAEVIKREKFRINPDLSPGGQTVITGAASGLGRALAIYLSPRRARLLLVDKDGLALEELAYKLENCTISIVDLEDMAQIDTLLASTEWNALNITELYACAGLGFRGRMQEISIDNHRKMFSINVLARIALGKNVIGSMRNRHFGRIVLISSSSAFQPLPYMATYAATNSALLSLGESWGAEVADDKLQIMTVCPGGMQTNFQKSGGVKEIEGEKLMTPEAVVVEIIEGLRQQKKTLIVSFRSFAMSMLARFLPRSLSVKLWFRLMEKMR
jgi:short-subunit dehydrogenase